MCSTGPASRYFFAFALLGSGILFAGGCKKGDALPPLYPVSGKVTVGDTPLTGGVITFVPDATKDNKSIHSPSGMIGQDGTYTLLTATKSGAPAGWYKVTIQTNIPGKESSVAINPRYSDFMRTDLSAEVTANAPAGKYDFKVSK